MFCNHCGMENPDNTNYCAGCGNLLQKNNVKVEDVNTNNQFQNPDYVKVTEGYNLYNKPKKSKAPFIILGGCATFFVIGVIVMVILISSIAKPKESISAEEFKNFMEEKDYVVSDATEQFANYDFVKKVYIAQDLDDDYQIEFYELEDESDAEDFYVTNSTNFDKYKENANVKVSSNVSGPNYHIYKLGTADSYKSVIIIDETGVFVDIDDDDAEEVKEVLKELKYN